jgi:hypothetical protein
MVSSICLVLILFLELYVSHLLLTCLFSGFGLAHTDETFWNKDLGNCMVGGV